MQDLQEALDELIIDCGDNYKIKGTKIVEVSDPVLKPVLRIRYRYYDRYVGEKGAYYNDGDYDTYISDGFKKILDARPEQFKVINKGYTFSHLIVDEVIVEGDDIKKCVSDLFYLEHLEEQETFVFNKTNEGYELSLTDSDIDFDEHEQNSMIYLEMKILDVKRRQQATYLDHFD